MVNNLLSKIKKIIFLIAMIKNTIDIFYIKF